MAIDVGLWQQRAKDAEDYQREQHSKWNEISKLYKGEFLGKSSGKDQRELSEMNFLYEYTDVKEGSIYARNPHIFCRSQTTTWSRFAETMEMVINYYWRELRLKQKVKQTIRGSILTPPNWIGVGYTGSLLKPPTNANIFSPETTPLKTEGQMGIMDETIKNENVFAKFISNWNMCWPRGYHDPKDAPYLIEIQELPLIDLYSNPIYKDSKYRINITKSTSQRSVPTKFTMKANLPLATDYTADDEKTKVKLYHIWDKRSNMRFTLAENFYEDTMFESPWEYLIEGFPRYPLTFNDVPATNEEANSFPMSDVEPMIPQLRDLSLFNTAMMRHGKRAGTVIVCRKGAIDPTQITNLQKSRDIEVVELTTISADAINTVQTPSIPSDWYKLRQVIVEDLMRISGFQQLLAQQQGVETATESENLKMGQLIRQSRSIDIMEDFTVDVARGLAGLIWQFIPRERIKEIIGEDVNAEMWPDLPTTDIDKAKKIIQSEIHFRIDAGSTRPPKDEAVERKQWIDSAAMMKQTFPGAINDSELAMQIAKKMGYKDLERLIKTNDEEEARVAQQENQLLLQGMIQLVSPNEKHEVHIAVHGQVYRDPMAKPTKELDNHILQHNTYMQGSAPGAKPQEGDTRAPRSTTMPELARRGTPDGSDLQGAAITTERGIGLNKG